MKKVLTLLLTFALLVSLAGCGSGGASAVVTSYCTALKNFDTAAMAGCLENSGSSGVLPEAEAEEAYTQLMDYMKECAGKMTYTVAAPVENGDTATVSVQFHYIDASAVAAAAISDYITQAFALALGGAEDAELSALFGTILTEKTESVETATSDATVEFTCTKGDDGWKISSFDTETMADIATSNIARTLNSLDSSDDTGADAPGEDAVWTDIPMNTDLQLATIKIRVTGYEETDKLTAEYLDPSVAPEGTKFVLFAVTIENTTKETLSFDNELKLCDSQGRNYDPYDDAYWYVDNSFQYVDLAPNIPQTGYLIYNVPADSANCYLAVGKAGTNAYYALYGA